MDLGISYHECNQCGALICPPGSISKSGEKVRKTELGYPEKESKLTDDDFMPTALYDEIQSGNHDGDANLVRFKGISRGKCVAILRKVYKDRRKAEKTRIKTKSSEKVIELRKIAKTVTETEVPDEKMVIEAERYEAIVEGDDGEGVEKCPVCGFVLVSWKG